MRKIVYVYYEDSDVKIRERIMKLGLREVARQSIISPSMLSRWLRKQTGLEEGKARRLEKAIRLTILT